LVHARSAFRNEGIVVENNMPFVSGDLAFGFNGELRGVRLSAPGETGAARLLHLLDRFRSAADGNVLDALERLDRVVTSRTEYVRALNVVAADADRLYLHNHYSEDPAYFTLHTATLSTSDGRSAAVVCSERLGVDGLSEWAAVANHTTLALEPATC
jgi:glutamine amidotransferase